MASGMRNKRFKHLMFELCLPPGHLPTPKVKQVLALLLEKYGWLQPTIYDGPDENTKVIPGEPFMDGMIENFEAWEHLRVTGKTTNEGLSIYPSDVYKGDVACWWPSDKRVRSEQGRLEHVQQVAELMRLVGSPLAYTALGDDMGLKNKWWVKGRWETTLEFLTDYSEGLLGIFWRTFLGPPFVRLFGERLASLPAGTARDLGGGVWLIEPYLMPADAFTEEGKASERAIIEHLGKECFFDHEHRLRPTRRPDLPILDVDALERAQEQRRLEKKFGKGAREVARSLKMHDFYNWKSRQGKEEHPRLVSRVISWARDHRDDPDFLDKVPEHVVELLRPAFERELEEEAAAAAKPAPADTAPADEASERVRTALKTSEALEMLLHLGRVAKDAEKAGELLDPTQKAQIQGVAALAQLATPRTPKRPRSKTPKRRKP